MRRKSSKTAVIAKLVLHSQIPEKNVGVLFILYLSGSLASKGLAVLRNAYFADIVSLHPDARLLDVSASFVA